ncbi:hypothetical protein BDS110ZK25_53430 [Bradyrhizobium diazoefficiens]
MRIQPGRPLLRITAIALACFTLGLVSSAPRTASAQSHLSMCTTAGFPLTCCKESYAKHGPFGTSYGAAKAARDADMVACQVRLANRKSR